MVARPEQYIVQDRRWKRHRPLMNQANLPAHCRGVKLLCVDIVATKTNRSGNDSRLRDQFEGAIEYTQERRLAAARGSQNCCDLFSRKMVLQLYDAHTPVMDSTAPLSPIGAVSASRARSF